MHSNIQKARRFLREQICLLPFTVFRCNSGSNHRQYADQSFDISHESLLIKFLFIEELYK